jgi:hypothetical protein
MWASVANMGLSKITMPLNLIKIKETVCFKEKDVFMSSK